MKDSRHIRRFYTPSPEQMLSPKDVNYLSREDTAIDSLFSHHCEGSSEAETIEVLETLKFMIDRSTKDRLIIVEIDIDRDRIHIANPQKRVSGKTKIWLTCHKGTKAQMIKRALLLIYCEPVLTQLKDKFGLGELIATEEDPSHQLAGGFEVDNGFLISSSKEIAQRFLKLFPRPLEEEENDS